MSELSLLNLLGSGITDITVVNRTIENAMKLAAKHQVNMMNYHHYQIYLKVQILWLVRRVHNLISLQMKW